jgi:hypothetical protein
MPEVKRKDTDREHQKWFERLDIGDVPESDRDLYESYALTNNTGVLFRFNLPLKSDGLYVLIAKYFFAGYEHQGIVNMTLNDNIELLANVDQYQQCGGLDQSHDDYFYFCVADNMLYHKNQSTIMRNGKIHIDLIRVGGVVAISSLVLLKGTVGERQKLTSSNTRELVDFDPAKMHPMCLGKKQQKAELTAVKVELQETQRDIEKVYTNLTDTILRGFRNLQHEQNSVMYSNIATASASKSNTMSCLEKIEQVNKNMETLKAEGRELQAEFKLRTDKVTKEVHEVHASLKSEIMEIRNQLGEIRNLLLESARPTEKYSDDIDPDQQENLSKRIEEMRSFMHAQRFNFNK